MSVANGFSVPSFLNHSTGNDLYREILGVAMEQHITQWRVYFFIIFMLPVSVVAAVGRLSLFLLVFGLNCFSEVLTLLNA